MEPTLFVWSTLAGLFACILWALTPTLARSLVRLLVRFLTPGTEAERLREEWLSVLLELERAQQLRFALLLFWGFRALQAEIEQRAAQAEVVDALLEERFDEFKTAVKLDLERRTKAEMENARTQLIKDHDKQQKTVEEELVARISTLERRNRRLEAVIQQLSAKSAKRGNHKSSDS